jgi:hypothetical protein
VLGQRDDLFLELRDAPCWRECRYRWRAAPIAGSIASPGRLAPFGGWGAGRSSPAVALAGWSKLAVLGGYGGSVRAAARQNQAQRGEQQAASGGATKSLRHGKIFRIKATRSSGRVVRPQIWPHSIPAWAWQASPKSCRGKRLRAGSGSAPRGTRGGRAAMRIACRCVVAE